MECGKMVMLEKQCNFTAILMMIHIRSPTLSELTNEGKSWGQTPGVNWHSEEGPGLGKPGLCVHMWVCSELSWSMFGALGANSWIKDSGQQWTRLHFVIVSIQTAEFKTAGDVRSLQLVIKVKYTFILIKFFMIILWHSAVPQLSISGPAWSLLLLQVDSEWWRCDKRKGDSHLVHSNT